MCGIVGYVGRRMAGPILMDGLKRLEYRGYDSAGISILQDGKMQVRKRMGKLKNLEEAMQVERPLGFLGLGHTRWATHGQPTEVNAHPHVDCSGRIAVVHNGIIENYQILKEQLIDEGHLFCSETDSEVIVHLVEKHFRGDLEAAVRRVLREVKGSYALGVASSQDPQKIVGAKLDSPLVVGLGKGESFLASDIQALLPYTREEIILDDGELVVISGERVQVGGEEQSKGVSQKVHQIRWESKDAGKGDYPHYMLKEIHEQPIAIRKTISGRIEFSQEKVRLEDHTEELLLAADRMTLVACGTSYFAGLAGKYLFEKLAGIPVEVDIASEFRYRSPVINRNTLTLSISQSGETADTLGAMKEAKRNGSPVLSICNVMGSSIARQADGVFYTHAGPEIGVASTKAFTTQYIALVILALFLGQIRGNLSLDRVHSIFQGLKQLPDLVQTVLDRAKVMEEWAIPFWDKKGFLYLGRGTGFPIALEGALKLKEVSYIYAEGYPAGEMKHGPIALIEPDRPVVILAPQGSLYEKILNNLEEVRARGGTVLAVGTQGDTRLSKKTDFVFYHPSVDEVLTPVLQVVPLQLLAYHIAVRKGCDVDKPRNLAKSVTVE